MEQPNKIQMSKGPVHQEIELIGATIGRRLKNCLQKSQPSQMIRRRRRNIRNLSQNPSKRVKQRASKAQRYAVQGY